MVECGGLENRCSLYSEPGVRIPLSPQSKITPSAQLGDFCFVTFITQFEKEAKQKDHMSETNKGVIWVCKVTPLGITAERREVTLYNLYNSIPAREAEI